MNQEQRETIDRVTQQAKRQIFVQFRKEGSEDIENEDIENHMISGELL